MHSIAHFESEVFGVKFLLSPTAVLIKEVGILIVFATQL